MKRRQGREYALQVLFQHDFTDQEPDLSGFWADKDEDEEGVKYTNSLVRGTLKNLEELDSQILKAAEHWALERMAVVDRNIMRLAAYELLYLDDIPSAVSISEALEIAKKYSSLDSAPFINGILDKIAKQGKKK